MTEASCCPPPARELLTATNRLCAPPHPGRARVLCLPPASLGCSQARKPGLTSLRSLGLLALVTSARSFLRWLACWALACLLREMVPRTISLAACDGAARNFACCMQWCRVLACLLRAMVPRAVSIAARDGAARNLTCCVRWCSALACLLRALVPYAGWLPARDDAPHNWAGCVQWWLLTPHARYFTSFLHVAFIWLRSF